MSIDGDIERRTKRDAREWHTVMNSGVVDEATRSAFEGWLHADKDNKTAYHKLEQMWRDLDYAAIEAGVDTTSAIQHRFGWDWRGLIGSWTQRPAWLAGGAIGFATMAFAVFTIANIQLGSPTTVIAMPAPDYITTIAEIRDITLEDGSVVTLGAKSELDTSFSPDSRQVTLLAGEAFFDIAKDPSRPFYVSVDDTLIRVVGTKFDVKRIAGDVHVSVLEGIVDVMKAEDLTVVGDKPFGRIETKRLTAGQKIVADKAPILPAVRQVESATPGEWRSGRLAYEDASLSEIVADVNRYSDRTIRITSNEIGDIRFTLAFQSNEIDSWLILLEQTQPVSVIDRGVGEIVLRPQR